MTQLDLQQKLEQAEDEASGYKIATERLNDALKDAAQDIKLLKIECAALQQQVKDLNEHLEEIYRAIGWSNARFEQTGDSPFDAINDLRLGAKVWWGKGQ